MGTLNLIGVGSPGLTQDTTPGWTPNIAELKGIWTEQWKISTGVSRAEMRCLDGEDLADVLVRIVCDCFAKDRLALG